MPGAREERRQPAGSGTSPVGVQGGQARKAYGLNYIAILSQTWSAVDVRRNVAVEEMIV